MGPTSIAADGQGHIFVADVGNRRIEKFTSHGKLLAQWPLNHHDLAFLAVAVDGAGNVYIAASWSECAKGGCTTGTVEKRSASGHVLAMWYLPRGLGDPYGLAIAVDPGGTSYVLSTSLEEEGEAGALTETQFEKRSATGAVLGDVSTYFSVQGPSPARRSGRDRLSAPCENAVATDWRGNVYVLTPALTPPVNRLQLEERSPSGKLVTKFDVSAAGDRCFGFGLNLNLAVDLHGYVYLADSYAGRITRLSPTGSRVTVWLSEPRGRWQLRNPADVALDREGNVYVADTGNNRIVKLSPAGRPLAQWGESGTGVGQLRAPKGIGVDGAGNLYVADSGNRRVRVFSSSGRAMNEWPLNQTVGGDPGKIAVGRNGNVYVFDVTVSGIGILVYSPTGKLLATWGHSLPFGAGDQLGLPGGIAVDEAGNVYVTDGFRHRIVKFSAQGIALAQWPVSGSQAGVTQGMGPMGLAVDGQGNVYVADASSDTLEKLAPDGTAIDRWGMSGVRTGQFHTPSGVAVDSRGSVYIADTGNNRIQKLTGAGQQRITQ